MSADPYTLYLLWDGDQLLYVGQTTRLAGRLRKHASTKAWWPQVTAIETHPYPDRVSVCQAECALIDQLEPLHNRPYTDAHRAYIDPEKRRQRQEARERWETQQKARQVKLRRRDSKATVVFIADLEDHTLTTAARLVNAWLSCWEGGIPTPKQTARALGIPRDTAAAAYTELQAAGYLPQATEEAA